MKVKNESKKMKVFISHALMFNIDKKNFFILTRPFFDGESWLNSIEEKSKWKIEDNISLVDDIEKAQLVLLPVAVNEYYKTGKQYLLSELNDLCQKYRIKIFGIVTGDFGIAYPDFSNITYFRMGGFKSQLSQNNKGFPVSLSDHFQRIFNQENPIPNQKRTRPIIGFCGHATTDFVKRFKEIVKFLKENCRRFFKNPFRRDWEPLFPSAYQRSKLLHYFENSDDVQTSFIYRDHYRAGAQTEKERYESTLEYYNNIADSDYVLCVRGAGNFSVRFYETLMMGKIPIFVNTDCLLPFDDIIDWKKHVVWVEWKERKDIVSIVNQFHSQLSDEEFVQMQYNNRKLWKETLSVNGMFNLIGKEVFFSNSNKGK